MRDPKRIFDILKSMELLWRLFPDWRFGQLLENVIGTRSSTGQIWFLEDDILETYLDDFYKNYISSIEEKSNE
jgi:hypothetical protein